MKLMIEIEKEDFETIVSKYDTFPVEMKRWGINAIKNGTPLPKGHGRLVDADEIQFENSEFDTYGDYCIAFDAIDQAETIIEADKESEEWVNFADDLIPIIDEAESEG